MTRREQKKCRDRCNIWRNPSSSSTSLLKRLLSEEIRRFIRRRRRMRNSSMKLTKCVKTISCTLQRRVLYAPNLTTMRRRVTMYVKNSLESKLSFRKNKNCFSITKSPLQIKRIPVIAFISIYFSLLCRLLIDPFDTNTDPRNSALFESSN